MEINEQLELLTKVAEFYAYQNTWDFGYYSRQVLLDISSSKNNKDEGNHDRDGREL